MEPSSIEKARLLSLKNHITSGVSRSTSEILPLSPITKEGTLYLVLKIVPNENLSAFRRNQEACLIRPIQKKITGFLLEDFSGNITWEHQVIEIDGLSFGVFFIEEADTKPIICKKDEADTIKNGEIYFRYGGRTQKIQYPELEAIITHRVEKQNSQWIDLVTKIGKSGPQNAAIVDVEKGLIEKNDSQILVVGDDLLDKIKWIKEGSFSEKHGSPTLKLIGEVQPIDKIEVIKKERINRLREYPLSAKELADQIKAKSGITQNTVWRIIDENKIKENPDYSCYNFRNKRQEEEYEQTGKMANGTPSIYRKTAIDYIIQIYNNEH